MIFACLHKINGTLEDLRDFFFNDVKCDKIMYYVRLKVNVNGR